MRCGGREKTTTPACELDSYLPLIELVYRRWAIYVMGFPEHFGFPERIVSLPLRLGCVSLLHFSFAHLVVRTSLVVL